jgi:hypothetical protein
LKTENGAKPHSALKSLEKLIGRWKVSGEAYGEVTFNWMEGGFFMVQDIDLIGAKGIEFIGYDEKEGILKSHYFDDRGNILECTYMISETEHIVTIDTPGIKGEFNGKFCDNGKIIYGNWKWVKDGKEMSYYTTLAKVNY